MITQRLNIAVFMMAAISIIPQYSIAIESMGNFSSLAGRMFHDDGDSLDTPEWLQEGAKSNQIAKYRGRRFLSFTASSTLTVTLEFSIPVSGIGSSDTLTIKNAIVFNLPTTAIDIFGRRIDDSHQRIDVYKKFEEIIGQLGVDGHTCTLRAICEVAELPFDHGVVGEVINMLFSMAVGPSHVQSNSIYDEYSTAEYYGRHYGNCGEYYPGCTTSVLDYFTRIDNDTV